MRDPAHYVYDSRVGEELLAGADALARAWGCPLEEHQGRPAVCIDAGPERRRFELPLPRTDFDTLDQFHFTVATAPDANVELALLLTCATTTDGLSEPDNFNSGIAEPLQSPAWREVLFPYENFLLYGIPPGVKNVAQATLLVNGTGRLWLGDWFGAKRKRAAGPRLTDAGLLAELDLSRPELAQVRELAAAPGRSFDALSTLLSHIKSRTQLRHAYGKRRPEEAGPLSEADAILRNHIGGFDVGTPVNWRANPNGYLEWMHHFNRNFFFGTLLEAWRATGDAKYVRKLDELFASWVAANPEPVAHHGGGDAAWETLSTACRIYGAWLECFFALLHEPAFSDATRLAMLKSFHGHATHLFHYKGYRNNWLVVESSVLYVLGSIFPEFKDSAAWCKEGLARLEVELERQVFPDGADWEFSPSYHMMAVQGFLDVYEAAQLNGKPLPPIFSERLPKTFDYIAGCTRPDGTLPSFNDSLGWRDVRGRAFLETGAKLFSRPELITAPEGPFEGKSRSFADAGVTVLAGGTSGAARWLFFDAGPFGFSHQHEDALSVELFAFGVPFLVDPGIASYLRDPWTEFYRSTAAHSTLLVNGAGQARVKLPHAQQAESARGKQRAAFGPVFDFASAEYKDGYIGKPAGLTHRRNVVFVRNEYYLLWDEVSGEGAQRIDALFHFSPMRVELDSAAKRVRTQRLTGANLELIPIEPRTGVKLKLRCGETDPVQGWAAEKGEDLPAPVAELSIAGQGPLTLVTLLVPYDTGRNSGVKVARLPKLPSGVLGFKVQHADGRADRIFLRQDASARLPGNPPLNAEVQVERLDAQGKPRTSAWLLGEQMTVSG